jgi:O-antigen/teichoic acid export membrane protein
VTVEAEPGRPPAAPPGGLRRLAARGTLVNSAFQIGLTTLGLVKGFVVAAFLTREDFGIWGILAVSLGTLLWLKQAGIGDKYVQQDEEDQELAFQKAFTLELAFSGAFLVLLVAVTPLIVVVYDEPRLLAPALAVSVSLMGLALQAPIWPFYRSMDFLRQRLLMSVDPVAAFVLTVALAIAGLGYWSLVIGTVAGSWIGAAVAIRHSPFPLALRYDRGALREYASFSWPLLLAGASGVVIAQSATLVANWELGLAAVGSVALGSSPPRCTRPSAAGWSAPSCCARRS